MGKKSTGDGWFKFVCGVVFIAIVAAAFVVRMWMAHGDVTCAFADDPALCATVKEAGE